MEAAAREVALAQVHDVGVVGIVRGHRLVLKTAALVKLSVCGSKQLLLLTRLDAAHESTRRVEVYF